MTTRTHSPATYADDDARWRAVVARDEAAEGSFWFSVATTGVYCYPSCAARRPRRENVRFHATRADAERAGFRPCKRCRPDLPPRRVRRAEAVERACRAIERALESGDQQPTLAALAADAGLSPHHFHRVFKAVAGVTPRAYAAARRAQRVRRGLRDGEGVTAAIHGAGYGSASRFYEQSDALLGMRPGAFAAGGAGVTVRWAVAPCWLGSVLVGATERGVAAILLGDGRGALARELRERLPRATLVEAERDSELARAVERVVALIEAPASGHALPLDVAGTAFQRRVWTALRQLPAGTTTTYGELARALGRPRASRAVARACAANPVAVAIPCHRVVAADGSPGGYRWGVDRKRALLEREASS